MTRRRNRCSKQDIHADRSRPVLSCKTTVGHVNLANRRAEGEHSARLALIMEEKRATMAVRCRILAFPQEALIVMIENVNRMSRFMGKFEIGVL